MPSVSSLPALLQAVAGFEIADPGLVIEPAAQAAARRSLDESGLLLLGEVHGVRENPVLIWALIQAFGLTRLALEWPEDLAPVIGAFLAGGDLAERALDDHWEFWSGDGRISAGHLAVLAERAAAGPLDLALFDGTVGADWSWSQRDQAMARRVLAASPPGTRTLVVAGNAHTVTSDTDLGTPMGACLAGERPGVQEIRISYGGGRFYNCEPRRFGAGVRRPRPPRLAGRDGALVLDLCWAGEAVVPQRAMPALVADGPPDGDQRGPVTGR
ncbi:MAG TPA: hypothetical protein VIX86_22295 [Streptosporangiaceae bacterium]